MILSGVVIISIPFVKKLYQFILAQIGLGILSSAIDVAGNAWLLELWKDKVNVLMQGMHFTFAIGMTIAPLIAAPFLAHEVSEAMNSSENAVYTTYGLIAEEVQSEETNSSGGAILFRMESQIIIPYSITAGAFVLSGLLMFIVSIIVPYKQKSRKVSESERKDEENNAKKTPSYFHPMYLIILSNLILCFFTGVEINSFSFLPDFAVYSRLSMKTTNAAFMTSVLSGSFALFRGLNILAATKVSSEVMLHFHFVLTCIGGLFLIPGAILPSVEFMWAFVIISGAGYSCMFPTVYAYLEERVIVNNFVTGVTVFSSSVSTIIAPVVVGFNVEKYPLIFMYLSVAGLGICVPLFLGLFVVERLHQKHLKNNPENLPPHQEQFQIQEEYKSNRRLTFTSQISLVPY